MQRLKARATEAAAVWQSTVLLKAGSSDVVDMICLGSILFFGFSGRGPRAHRVREALKPHIHRYLPTITRNGTVSYCGALVYASLP